MRFRNRLAAAVIALGATAGAASAAILPMPVPSSPSPFQTVADKQMLVATNYAHLRAKPTTHSDKLATLKHGTKVDVIELVDHGKWAHVKVIGKVGYISANLLK